MKRIAVLRGSTFLTMGVIAALMVAAAGRPALACAITIEPYTRGSGTTEWVNSTSAIGDWSLQLNNPAAGGNHYAGVQVRNLCDPQVKHFDGWDYWTKSNAQFAGGYAVSGVNFTMLLDTSYPNIVIGGTDYGYDVMLNVMPHNTLFDSGFADSSQPIPADTWVNLNSSTRYPYQFFAWDGDGTYLGGHDIARHEHAITWSEFQALDPIFAHVDWGTWDYTYDFSEATVNRILMRTGGGGLMVDVTAYLDDFTLDGILVTAENGFTVIPEPATVLLLGMGLGGLALVRRRRKHE